MSYMFSFIGTGNMGGALARAAARKLPGNQILLSNRTEAKARKLAEELNCQWGTAAQAAQEGKYIFLGVKPQMMAALLEEIRPSLQARTSRFILVSMAAGLTMSRIAGMAGLDCPVIRIMPNTPCAVGEGMILCDANPAVTGEEMNEWMDLLSGAGAVDRLEETLIDAASAVSGCGPAFLCLMMEAMADGGVACGLPRQKAMLYAAQTVRGTAALLLASGDHPGTMKDAVCSPGGSTIAGVRTLEERGFRGAAMDAVIAAAEKNRELGK